MKQRILLASLFSICTFFTTTAQNQSWTYTPTSIYNYNGNIGLGVLNPSQRLDISGNIRLATYGYQEFNIGNTKGYIWGNHDYAGSSGVFHDDLVLSANWQGVTSNTDNIVSQNAYLRNNAISIGRHGIRFFTSSNATSAPTEKITFTSDGNVGIGTTNSLTKLDIRAISYSGNQDNGISIKANGGAADGIWQTRYVLKSNATGNPRAAIDFVTRDYNTGNVQSNVEALSILYNGNIGLGTITPQYKLDVKGAIRATEIKVVSVDQFADYVFEPSYKLPKLSEVDAYIQDNGHLPDVPSASDVKENGLDVVDMQVTLLRKVEELTLYVIDQQKKIATLEQKLAQSQK